MTSSLWLWIGFNVFVLAMLALDLGVFHRTSSRSGNPSLGPPWPRGRIARWKVSDHGTHEPYNHQSRTNRRRQRTTMNPTLNPRPATQHALRGDGGSEYGGPTGQPTRLPPVPRPRRLVRTGALLALVVAMYVLHQDFWNWQRIKPLVFGFLPIGLAYHAAYSILAAGMMAVLVRFAWPRHLEKVEPHTAPADRLRTEATP